jgi:regulator of ribonuclease activity A
MSPATADLYDRFEDILQSCELQFRRIGGRKAFFGAIRTVKCHEDNALLKDMLSSAGEGQVLVVDGGGSLRTALVGDVIAGLGVKNGWAGIIVNGAVRDTDAIGELDIGLKALGFNPRKSTKTKAGAADIPVQFGGVTFQPGHWLYSDADGVVISPKPLHEDQGHEDQVLEG